MTVKQKKLPEIEKVISEWTEVSERIAKSYMESLPNLVHSGKDFSNAWLSFVNNIAVNPPESMKMQHSYLNFYKKQVEMWQEINKHLQQGKDPFLADTDKRFKSKEWSEYPYYFYFIKQTYLMVSELVSDVMEHADIDEAAKKKLKFYTKLYIDAMSPSNFLTTNPEVIKLAQQTNGESLIKGFKNLVNDMKQGKITQTDFSAFEVGKNIAATVGSVVFENDLIQLIQYKPLTKKTHETPLLIVPPLINRYYILDLEQKNSFARFAVEQGYTVFMISWRPSNSEIGKASFDDYVQKGILDTIKVVQDITKEKKINALGYCIGGTLLATGASILASQKKNDLNSITFLASMLDFSDFGEISAVVDLPLVERLEKEIGQNGVLKGQDMNSAFMMIRANDMIWNYVVNNYLKGTDPVPFSTIFWTNDSNNLPGNMFTFYLKNMMVGNKLSKKNALKILDTPIDLGKIKAPGYVMAAVQDHISPSHTAYTTTKLIGGNVEFVLAESGHVTGVVNPPTENNKYGYYSKGKMDGDINNFRNTATLNKESWWLHWSKWLKQHSGQQINAPLSQGSSKYKVIEPAPGRYVKEHSEE